VRLIWLLLLAGGALAGGEAGPTLGWSNMVWQAQKLGGRDVPHAALMVEVAVEGLPAPALMQLDTGALNWVYRVPKDAPWWRGNQVAITGRAAGRRFHDEWFGRRDDPRAAMDGKPIVGTLGAPFFENRVLILDFVGSRLAILDTLPPAVEQRAAFTPLEYRDGKMFVAFTVDGRQETQMFYDSGSSAFAIATTRTRWMDLTGRM